VSALDTVPKLDPHALRNDFPILNSRIRADKPLVYLDNAASTQRPRKVIQTLVDVYENYYANVHRGVHWLSDQSTDRYENAREKVQNFIHAAHSHEVIFTMGTTAAINLVARTWGDQEIHACDEIVLTVMEHHSNIVPWQQLAERRGCKLRFADIRDDGQLDMEEFDRLINEKTRLVAIVDVSNVLGTSNPLPQIIKKAHTLGALVLVDAAQSIPHSPLDMQQLGADFLVFSGHKMMGPSGIGVLYAREQILENMPPFFGGGSMIRRVKLDGFETAELPAKFEAGTPPIVSAIGLGAAIDYLEEIGLRSIQEHERRLTKRTHLLLSQVSGVRILGPAPEKKAGIVSFVLEGVHAHDVAQICDRHGVAIRAGHHCAMPLHKRLKISASSRASFYVYNTDEDIDKLVEALIDAKQIIRRGK